MNAAEKLVLPDIQSTAEHRRTAFQQVRVKSIVHPVAVRTATGMQSSVAESIHNHSAYAVVEGTSP